MQKKILKKIRETSVILTRNIFDKKKIGKFQTIITKKFVKFCLQTVQNFFHFDDFTRFSSQKIENPKLSLQINNIKNS